MKLSQKILFWSLPYHLEMCFLIRYISSCSDWYHLSPWWPLHSPSLWTGESADDCHNRSGKRREDPFAKYLGRVGSLPTRHLLFFYFDTRLRDFRFPSVSLRSKMLIRKINDMHVRMATSPVIYKYNETNSLSWTSVTPMNYAAYNRFKEGQLVAKEVHGRPPPPSIYRMKSVQQ